MPDPTGRCATRFGHEKSVSHAFLGVAFDKTKATLFFERRGENEAGKFPGCRIPFLSAFPGSLFL